MFVYGQRGTELICFLIDSFAFLGDLMKTLVDEQTFQMWEKQHEMK